MVMVKVGENEWYEDKKFLHNLDIYLDAMESNDDLLIVVDGLERSGKSFRIRQIAKYCAYRLGTKFSDKNVHFELKQYLDFSIESPQYTVCVLDEGRNVLNRKSSMSKINKKFTNYISECAKKRQVHIIASPAFHDLDKYIILWRMKFLIHTHKWYVEDNTKKGGYKLARGKYTMYMNNNYLKDSYKYPYNYPKRWETIGAYSNVEVFNNDELKNYEDKKDENLEIKYHSKHEEERINKKEKTWRKRWYNLVKCVLDDTKLKIEDIASYCNMNTKLVRESIRYTDKNKNKK